MARRVLRVAAGLGCSALLIALIPATAVSANQPSEPTIVLAFAGDVHFEEQVAAQARPGGLRTLPGLFGNADFAMVNLETALTNGGKPQAKTYTFRAPTAAALALSRAGVDVVTMANNHALDYGRTAGLTDLLSVRRDGPLAIAGVGKNAADAVRPLTYRLGDNTLAVFAVSEFWLLADWPATSSRAGLVYWSHHRRLLLKAVRAAAASHDVVAVYVHWGIEYQKCPNSAQQRVARELAAAGADLVVGSHPHVIQGVRWVGNTLVAFSLGNFVWYGHRQLPSMLLKVQVKDGQVTGFSRVPVRYGRDGLPRTAVGEQAAEVRRAFAVADRCSTS